MNKPILLDGAVGTSLWAIAEENGVKKDPVWIYNMTHPEFVDRLVREYVDAGAKIILANTFGANGPMVRRVSKYDPAEVVKAGVRITKQAVGDSGIPVALSAGPLAELMEPWGDLTEEEVAGIYREMLDAGMSEGADCIVLQTFIDLDMMRVAASVALTYGVPVYCMMTFEKVGKTMMGNSVQDVIDTLEPMGVSGLGLNCSIGPDLALPIIREFREKTSAKVFFKPNAGLPKTDAAGKTTVAYTAERFAEEIAPALDYVDYVGGCCGCDASYVRAIGKLLSERDC